MLCYAGGNGSTRNARLEHSIRDVLLSEEVCAFRRCRCSWRERVLHFAIAAIRRATRKTSLKGHTRRVIRLYVTRPSPSRIQLNVMEMSGTFVRGNSVCVPVGWSFSPKRAQEELLLVLFRSVAEYRCAGNMRLTALRAFCHIEETSLHIDCKELHYCYIKSLSYIYKINARYNLVFLLCKRFTSGTFYFRLIIRY